jgi:asparagine synthase (glutamine-hydrolysing)
MFSYTDQCQLLRTDWRPRSEEDLAWPFAEYWDSGLDTVKAAQVFDVQTYLQEDILTKVDRASMQYGVEARVPLLAKPMIEMALRTSTGLHFGGGRRKNILKAVIRGRVPDSLLSNRKRGFSLPLEVVLGPTLRAWLTNIDDSVLVRDGVLSPRIAAGVAENLDRVWTLFALDRWWSAWIRQEEPRDQL